MGLIWPVTGALLAAGSLAPEANTDMLREIGRGLLTLLPVVVVAALLAGALTTGRWSDRALSWLKGGPVRSVVIASLIGAITPVCGLGVLPLIATLLRRGLPIAPVMAFWVASPVTDPSMLLITARNHRRSLRGGQDRVGLRHRAAGGLRDGGPAGVPRRRARADAG